MADLASPAIAPQSSQGRHPPGPKGLPVIGHLWTSGAILSASSLIVTSSTAMWLDCGLARGQPCF